MDSAPADHTLRPARANTCRCQDGRYVFALESAVLRCGVAPSTTLHPGQHLAVKFDDDRDGEKVSVWMFSGSFDLGTRMVKKNGRVSVTVP